MEYCLPPLILASKLKVIRQYKSFMFCRLFIFNSAVFIGISKALIKQLLKLNNVLSQMLRRFYGGA